MAEEMGLTSQEIAEKCKSEEDLYQMVCGEMLPEGEELTEGDLELVVGGMSNSRAIKIATKAYWDLCVKKKGSTCYSDSEIYEALDKVEHMRRIGAGVSVEVFKWGIRWLAKH